MSLGRNIFSVDDFQRFQSGDHKVYKKVFDYYFPIILRYAYTKCKSVEDAEELAQEALTLLYVHRTKVDSPEGIYPYLYVIIKRLCISFFRKKISQTGVQDQALQDWSMVSNETMQQIDYAELTRVLESIIQSLPPQQQEIYRLNKIEDRPQQEIADELEISRNTVKNHLLSATKVVRLKLQKVYFFLF